MRLSHLIEPQLEFGQKMRHVDSRYGLIDNGPFDAGLDGAPTRIRIGIVGSAQTIEGTVRWIERSAEGIEAKPSRQPNLFPRFPGLGADSPFRSEFVTAEELQRTIPPREIARLVAIEGQAQVTRAIADSIVSEIESLAERTAPPSVVLVALPIEFIQRTVNARAAVADGETAEEPEAPEVTGGPDLDFRGLLKAACMRLRIPIQILWPTTYDASFKIPRKLKEASDRRVQDDATRAWNMFTAVYYKAGGLPWRLARDSTQLRTSYVGISFYRSIDGEEVNTSTAQMFDERGEGLILRGGRAVESSEDRRPHLTAEDAYKLLAGSLTVFRKQHGHYPARVVLHKTSKFDANELDGFHRAINERDIDYADLVAISKSFTRLYRQGAYPPLRGTLLRIDKDQALLYTRGSVDFFKTYPGMYVPRPLLLRCQVLGQPLQHIAEEVLSLSKMNWNNTQFDNGMPVTIAAAHQVGEVLKYVPDAQEIAPRYSFYM
jgi:hypothetical protein